MMLQPLGVNGNESTEPKLSFLKSNVGFVIYLSKARKVITRAGGEDIIPFT